MLTDVKHQDQAIPFLRSMVENRFTDPLLLVGEEGVGRRFSALQAIKEVVCRLDRKSECPCSGCYQVDHGCHPDLLTITGSDDSRIKVETLRAMLDLVWESPTVARNRFILVDGVDKMSVEDSANVLLKLLEEPPPLARFILLAESLSSVLPTVQSRCGKITYRPLPDSFVVSVLNRFSKGLDNVSIYSRMGEGSVGRALSYAGAGRIALRDRVLEVLQRALKGDIPVVFSTIDTMGQDLPLALRFMGQLLHDLLMVEVTPDRMINLDRIEPVRNLRNVKKDLSWCFQLGSGLKAVLDLHRRTSILLSFHLKALFAETFASV